MQDMNMEMRDEGYERIRCHAVHGGALEMRRKKMRVNAGIWDEAVCDAYNCLRENVSPKKIGGLSGFLNPPGGKTCAVLPRGLGRRLRAMGLQ